MARRPEQGHEGGAQASASFDLFGDLPESPPADVNRTAGARALPDRPSQSRAPGEVAESAVSVATLTRIAKDVVEGAFAPLWIRGEVTDFKAHRNGHWYFCLRDQKAQVKCVVWSRDRFRIPVAPDEGMQIVARGQLTVYPARGDMQFVVVELDGIGDGLWRKAMEATRARLEVDGLLAPARKRRLPPYPRRVAVVTSLDGAALRDIIAVARRRSPDVEIIVVPARVQGDGAAGQIVAAIERVGRWGLGDILIVGRGGGGREDLWAFNDERVARAVASCPIPTISAVGHEIDITLCDLVADVRAATPSAAAEAAIPLLADMHAALTALAMNLRGALKRRAALARRAVDRAGQDLSRAGRRVIELRRARIESLAGRLDALSPLAVLTRGYAVAQTPEGVTHTSIESLPPGTQFRLRMNDGVVRATSDALEREQAVSPRKLSGRQGKEA
ncbi:MAG: exodeoxyribonuclease VII large subunit [Anaerolineae bacterium]|nr:exodeoxyribonuclease VII large subunit [Gemmatimonadaceae bacterium]